MDFIEVRNEKDTSEERAPSEYKSWLDFWEKKKGKKAVSCEVMTCDHIAEVGGHVIKIDDKNYLDVYIMLLCYACNNKPEDEVFKAWEGDLILVE